MSRRIHDIHELFDDYRDSAHEGCEHQRQQIAHILAGMIATRIERLHGKKAEEALKRVLLASERLDIPPQKGLDALEQLCRLHDFEYSDADDAKLIRDILDGVYFQPLDLRLDTSDGVL